MQNQISLYFLQTFNILKLIITDLSIFTVVLVVHVRASIYSWTFYKNQIIEILPYLFLFKVFQIKWSNWKHNILKFNTAIENSNSFHFYLFNIFHINWQKDTTYTYAKSRYRYATCSTVGCKWQKARVVIILP